MGKAKRDGSTPEKPTAIGRLAATPAQRAAFQKVVAEKFERAAQLDRARANIDRAIAVRDGLIEPPWAEPRGGPEAEIQTATKRKAKPKPEKERKSYWDDAVTRVLKEKFPNNDANTFRPGVVRKLVQDALADEVKQSGRREPGRGLILRKTGHWKT
ncbi:hypothetical protein JQ633_06685 [Bradyrhizobium tropiciagri]|uniref:hypothetical protein n=1 Tax=Bradyrhizobium tropiciagri TaxID=312253 RepID=UPI001BAA8908|nr:hypothetical protein [Bradyrhizobium tropiciagri]MBR0870036.1 hypothetical protein [Bradyrhizobium tropiciagri]